MNLIEEVSSEKLRGGFYTPAIIAKFILRWAVNGNKNYDILEPSCGDGIFLKQIKENKFLYKSITALEIEPKEAQKASKIPLPNMKVINTDFYKYCYTTDDKFDLVIGNPPYIRYQYFDKNQREIAENIFKKINLHYSKLTNPWVSFVVGSSLLLKEKGKIAFVLPGEILQVTYAKQLRDFLAHYFNKINIISFRKLVFPGVQQEIVLLLCEKNDSGTHLIEHLEVNTADDLQNLDIQKLKYPKKKIDFKSNKWTFYFLDQKEIDFIENILHKKSIKPLRNYAKVEVGITTGFNKFFSVTESTVNEYNLKKYVHPLVGRSANVPSIIFKNSDWKSNVQNNMRSYLISFPTRKKIVKKGLEYIKKGEKEGIQNLYKCGNRDEWQIVPSTWVSEALFLRRNHIYPKFTLNLAKAYTTDTMHRVTVNKNKDILTNKKIDLRSLIASYYNSLSFAFTEIYGRSHGGGALELMPNEVEDILIPYDEKNKKILSKIDTMIRKGVDIDEILKFTDNIILKRLGFSNSEIKLANTIWKKLLNRRLERSKK